MTEERVFLPSARRPRPGRPRKADNGHVPGTSHAGGLDDSGRNGRPLACEANAPLLPRLLDVHRTAEYLSMPESSVYDLAARGVLPRVRVPLPDGQEIRRLYFDKSDLDRLIDSWKE